MKCTGTELKALSFVDVHTYVGNCKTLIYKKYHKEGILFLSKPYFPEARKKDVLMSAQLSNADHIHHRL